MSIKVGDKDLFPYLGDYRPVNIYKGEHKVAGWKRTEQSGKELLFENTYNDFVEVEVDGKSYQDGAPTPDYPIEIHSLNDFDVVSSVEKLTEGQLEEYDYDSEYENVDKINLSLSEPLRSVGDVKDRLFRDSDGLWKVERNIGEFVADGSESVRASNHANDTQTYHISIYAANSLYTSSSINITQSSHYVGRCWKDVYSGQDGIAMERTHLRVRDDRFSYDVNLFKVWLSEQHAEGNPLTVQYHIEPTIETLDQELQDKLNNLRSFQGSNYIYTIINDKTDVISETLKPTLHARLKVKDI